MNSIYKAYQMLGVNPDCTDDALKKRYRTLAHKYHPDKWEMYPEHITEDLVQKFSQITHAYEEIQKYRSRETVPNDPPLTTKKQATARHEKPSTRQASTKKVRVTATLNKKYFIVFYSYYGGESNGAGHTTFVVNTPYINRKKIVSFMEEELGKKYGEKFTVIITNIIQLSSQEHQAWVE